MDPLVREATWRRLHHLPPVGYVIDYDRACFVPDPVRFPVLRRAWELALAGVALTQILRTVNHDMGLRTPVYGRIGGRPLGLRKLYKLFEDPFYAGIVIHRGHAYEAAHEKMVTSDEFLRVRSRIARSPRRLPGCRTNSSDAHDAVLGSDRGVTPDMAGAGEV